MDNLRFVQLTDLHLQGDGEKDLFGFDTYDRARVALNTIEIQNLKPDFFAITGDIANNGTAAAYKKARMLVDEVKERFGVPVFLTLGNHDKREGFKEVFEVETHPKYYHSQEINGFRLLFLDSKNDSSVSGSFDEEQMNWLEKELDNYADKKAIIFFHHPMVTTPLAIMDGIDFKEEGIERFRKIVKDKKNILAIFNGHTHFDLHTVFENIPTILSSATAFALDPHDENVMKLIDNGGFMVGTVRNGSIMASPIKIGHSGEVLLTIDPSTVDMKELAKEFDIDEEEMS